MRGRRLISIPRWRRSGDGRPQWVCRGRASDRRGGARAPASRCLVVHRLAGWWAVSGRYRTIVADPPWPIEWSGGGAMRVNGRGERHVNHKFNADLPYGRMLIEGICALPVGELAEPDAHLYLWIPDEFLIAGDGARVLQAWGFPRGRLL